MGKVMDEIVFLKNFRARFKNDSDFVSAVKDMYQNNMISAKAWEIIRDDYSSATQIKRTSTQNSKTTEVRPLSNDGLIKRPPTWVPEKALIQKPTKDPCSRSGSSNRGVSPCS